MNITYVQILGFVLLYAGIHGFIKGKIEWEVTVGGSGYDGESYYISTPLGDNERRYEGVWDGVWVRVVFALLSIFGLLLMFVVTGEEVAFSI